MLAVLRLFFLAFVRTLRDRHRRGPLRPTWSFSFEWVVRYLRSDWDETSSWPLPRVRAAVDGRPYPKTFVRKVDVRDASLGGVPVRWFDPRLTDGAEARARGVVVFFHGGSFAYGSVRSSHAELCARLALESGVRVVGVDYRLAPEHPFPAQIDDASAVFDALVASGVAAADVILAGDSAGGNLAAMLAIRLRDREPTVVPRALALVSPWSDLTMPAQSFVDNDLFDYGTRDVLLRQARAYAGNVSLDDARISPVKARLVGLPPTFVTYGDAEIPRGDIEALIALLGAAGVAVETHVARDMPHNPPLLASYHRAGAAALGAMAAFVRAQLG